MSSLCYISWNQHKPKGQYRINCTYIHVHCHMYDHKHTNYQLSSGNIQLLLHRLSRPTRGDSASHPLLGRPRTVAIATSTSRVERRKCAWRGIPTHVGRDHWVSHRRLTCSLIDKEITTFNCALQTEVLEDQ